MTELEEREQYGVREFSFNTFNIGVYKYFTLCHSLIKIDLVLNLFFILTLLYFTYDTEESLMYCPIDILFMVLVMATAVIALKSITEKNRNGYFIFSSLRMFIELIKIAKTILIIMDINAAFSSHNNMEELGSFRFSVLV